MCPICRKPQKEMPIKVAARHGVEVCPECYEPYLLFVKQVNEAHAEARR